MAESRPQTLLNDLRLPFDFSSWFDREVNGIRNYRVISHTNNVFVIHRDRVAIQRTVRTLCSSAELRSYYGRTLFRLLNHHVYSRRKQNKQESSFGSSFIILLWFKRNDVKDKFVLGRSLWPFFLLPSCHFPFKMLFSFPWVAPSSVCLCHWYVEKLTQNNKRPVCRWKKLYNLQEPLEKA